MQFAFGASDNDLKKIVTHCGKSDELSCVHCKFVFIWWQSKSKEHKCKIYGKNSESPESYSIAFHTVLKFHHPIEYCECLSNGKAYILIGDVKFTLWTPLKILLWKSAEALMLK